MSSSIKSYLLAMMAGAVMVLTAFAGVVLAAEWALPSLFPPPAISGNLATDEKLRYLRERKTKNFDLLAVGSSVTWMHLDGEPFEDIGGIVNGGTARVQMHQIRFLTRFYLDMFPEISSVLMLTALPDYEDCQGPRFAVLDEDDATAYVQAHYPTPYFYLRYFVPLRYVIRARNRTKQQQPYYRFGYWMDEYGTTPTIRPGGTEYDLRYAELPADPVCFEELGKLASELAERNVDFNLVVTPVNPLYLAKFPAAEAGVTRLINFARDLGISVHDLYSDSRFDRDDYWDAFHLQWPAAQRLSRDVAQKLLAARTPEPKELAEQVPRSRP